MTISPDQFIIPGPYETMADIKAAALASPHSRYWFSDDTMAFFNCQLESDPIAGRFFITSEGEPSIGIARRFTVRACDDAGEIHTVLMDEAHKGSHTGDGFMGYMSLITAEHAVFKHIEKCRIAADAVLRRAAKKIGETHG